MDAQSDVLIIGGGIIGLAIAVELAQAGVQVTVLSRDFKQAAVHAAAGMLAPQAEGLPPGAMLDLCQRSLALYPAWTERLTQLTGIDPQYWNCGILQPQLADLTLPDPAMAQGMTQQRYWLNQTEVHQQQPGLSPQVVGGWWLPQEGQVNNRILAQALWLAAQTLGVELHEGIAVTGFQTEQQHITRIHTSAGEWQAPQVVLASGAWSQELLPLPVTPRKGQMLSVQAPREQAEPLQHVLFGDNIYLVPRRNGLIVVGATSESIGFTPGNTPAGVRSLLDRAIELYPPIQQMPLQECWWGFRPATPDEWPILGFGPYQNLVLATGHFRNGILLAPITAQLIAQQMAHQIADPLLAEFSWHRFARVSCQP